MSQTQKLLPDTPTKVSSKESPRSGHLASGGRRRMLEVVTGSGLVAVWLVFGSLPGLGFVGFVLLGALLLSAFQTLVRRRSLRTLLVRDTASFAHGWAGKLLVAAVLIVLIGAVTVAVVSAVLFPNLASARNGDRTVLAHLDHQASMGTLDGYHDVAVAEVDLNAAQPVRLAGIGADNTTPMEVGSMTKAMTGLVIADAVRRGEIRMDDAVST